LARGEKGGLTISAVARLITNIRNSRDLHKEVISTPVFYQDGYMDEWMIYDRDMVVRAKR